MGRRNMFLLSHEGICCEHKKRRRGWNSQSGHTLHSSNVFTQLLYGTLRLFDWRSGEGWGGNNKQGVYICSLCPDFIEPERQREFKSYSFLRLVFNQGWGKLAADGAVKMILKVAEYLPINFRWSLFITILHLLLTKDMIADGSNHSLLWEAIWL